MGSYLVSHTFYFAQQELKSIDEVIDGIDSLLGDIQPVPPTLQTRLKSNSAPFDYQATDDDSVPFRVNNELMPDMFLEPKEEKLETLCLNTFKFR